MPSGDAVDAELTEAIRAWIESRLGFRFGAEQDQLFRARLELLCRPANMSAQQVYSRLTAGDHALMLRAGEVFSTNYTMFFRESEVFDVVRTSVIPTLPTDGGLRLWSAAASSGEEAYSLAIFFQELLGEWLALARVRILGTDISEGLIRAAERGTYPALALEVMSGERRMRYFEPADAAQFRARASLRQMCTFRRMNLNQSVWPFTQRFHLIFLRNVLYYFDANVQRHVVEACYDATEPGGWLITSLTEPMLDVSTRWLPVQPGVFRKGAW
jgi:chemotaxis protein methyltransferase CheR